MHRVQLSSGFLASLVGSLAGVGRSARGRTAVSRIPLIGRSFPYLASSMSSNKVLAVLQLVG
eukprot:5662992-Amphidinium_carterae.1